METTKHKQTQRGCMNQKMVNHDDKKILFNFTHLAYCWDAYGTFYSWHIVV